MKQTHHIQVLTGPVQGGKTTFVAEQLVGLKTKGIRVHGFLCPGTLDRGRRSGFTLQNIHTGQQLAMGSETKQTGWLKYKRFYFNPAAFILGRAWIEHALSAQADLLVIDEVGPMELEGMGWSEILHILEHKTGMIQLWIVRQDILPEVSGRWHIPEQAVYTKKSLEKLFETWET